MQAWWRYRYTGDQQWLRTHGYPLLRGTVEFYRHLVKKEEDGRYHLSGTNVHEDFWGVRDSIMDLAAIRGTAPLAIRAAEILEVDAELRGQWKDLLEHLAPIRWEVIHERRHSPEACWRTISGLPAISAMSTVSTTRKTCG